MEEEKGMMQKGMMQKEAGDWMRMEIESSSRNEEFARVTAAVFLSRLDPTLEEINDVKTAVSEAVTNCVIHGYECGRGVIYVARAMEPMYTSDATGERSGMGFAFMEAFMDEVAVDSQPGRGTRVTMKKKIGR